MKMNRKRLLLGLTIVLVLTALYLMALTPQASAGASASPGLDTLSFAARGPHAVGTRNMVIGGDIPVEITMWYPGRMQDGAEEATTYPYEIQVIPLLSASMIATYQGQALREARPDLSASPYPLAILSPGFAIGSTTYGWLAEHLASHGFVVLSAEHDEYLFTAMSELWRSAVTRPLAIPAVLDYVDRQVETGGDLGGLIDPGRVAVIGHSYGGYTALAAGGAQLDTSGFEARCQTAYEQEDPAAWLCDALLPHIADMAELAGLQAIPAELWPTWADRRVDAIVSMAGDAYLFDQAGLAQLSVPLMAIGGTLDGDTLYVLLKPVSQSLSLASALSRAAEGIIQSVNVIISLIILLLASSAGYLAVFEADQINALALLFLNAYDEVILIWGLFFGFHLVLLGTLVYRSGYFPRFLGILLVLAGVGYFMESYGHFLAPQFDELLGTVVLVLAVPGELVFTVWLLWKGIDVEQWEERVLESAHGKGL